MSAMAKATKAAGLTVNGTEQEMFKLMERGQLLAKDVLPFFAEELRSAARQNNALETALEQNLNPALGRARLTLQELSNAIFKGGLKQGVMFLLDGFSSLGSQTKELATGIGSFLGGAIFGLTLPIRLVLAAIADLRLLMKDVFGITDEGEKAFFKFTGVMLGAAVGVGVLIKALRMLLKVGKSVKAMFGIGRAAATAASAAISGGAGATAARAASAAISGGAGAIAARAAGVGLGLGAAGALATLTATVLIGEAMRSPEERAQRVAGAGEMVQRAAAQGMTPREFISFNPATQNLNVNLRVVDSEFSSAIKAEVENGQANMVSEALTNIGGSNNP